MGCMQRGHNGAARLLPRKLSGYTITTGSWFAAHAALGCAPLPLRLRAGACLHTVAMAAPAGSRRLHACHTFATHFLHMGQPSFFSSSKGRRRHARANARLATERNAPTLNAPNARSNCSRSFY